MEKTISELKASGLEIRLTDEKLYLNTPAKQETMALRSVNGVAIVDLIDDYNTKLTAFKKQKQGLSIVLIMGIAFIVFSLANLISEPKSDGAPSGIALGLVIVGIYFFNKNKNVEPTLMSVVRIHTNGGSRDFEFDKKGVFSGNVAEFVARIEDTLTAFHKNS